MSIDSGSTHDAGSAPAGAAPAGTRSSRRRGGPPLPAPIAAYAALMVAGAATYTGGMPTDDAPTTLATLSASPTMAAVSSALLLASAAPLAVWTAAAVHRTQTLGARVAGPMIGLVGGTLAVVSLLISGIVGATAASAATLGDAPLVRALSTLSFLAGGPAFALGSALLIAGVAVPAYVLRLVPRTVPIIGLVVAVVGALTPLILVFPALAPMLPVVRFGGLLWLIAMSVLLPVHRRDRVAS